ncbi:MAG: hypothetical protein V7L21_10540 [Nostoc sp.]|nr:hypothetical protein [Nostoc sp. NMS9]
MSLVQNPWTQDRGRRTNDIDAPAATLRVLQRSTRRVGQRTID